MSDTKTVRVYDEDKERLDELEEQTGWKAKEIIGELLREPEYVCPECGESFYAEEIDQDSVRLCGTFTADLSNVLTGKKEVESFECPRCDARITPDDVEKGRHCTVEELGVSTEEKERDEFVTSA